MSCPIVTPLKIEFYVGDTHAVRFTVRDQDDNAIDLTDGTGELYLKSEVGDILATIPGVIEDGPNGVVVYEFQPADTNTLEAGAYMYTAKVTTVDDKLYTISVGPLVLLPN